MEYCRASKRWGVYWQCDYGYKRLSLAFDDRPSRTGALISYTTVGVCMYIYVCIYPASLLWAGWNPRSVFKWSTDRLVISCHHWEITYLIKSLVTYSQLGWTTSKDLGCGQVLRGIGFPAQDTPLDDDNYRIQDGGWLWESIVVPLQPPHLQLLCRGVRPLPPTSVLDMTQNNLMVRLQ